MFEFFNASNTDFDNNCDMLLKPNSATLTVDIKGGCEIALSVDYDKFGRWKHIEKLGVIRTGVFYSNQKQKFRIYDITKDMDGLTIKARHIFYDLTKKVSFALAFSDTPINDVANAMLGGTGFTAEIDYDFSTSTSFKKSNIVKLMLGDDANSILKQTGGQVLLDGNKIIIKPVIGENKGLSIVYSRNLSDLNIDENTDKMVTRYYPVIQDTVDKTYYVDSPLIDKYSVVMESFYDAKGKKVKTKNTKPVTDENITYYDTVEDLKADVEKDIKKLYEQGADKPSIVGTVQITDIDFNLEYSNVKDIKMLGIGDVLNVYHQEIGVNLQTQCTGVTYDLITGEYDSITLGEMSKSIFDVQAHTTAVVNGITTDTGEVDGSQVNSLDSDQISDLDDTVKKITNIDVINATIKNLTATKIDANQLDVFQANINKLISKYATIQDLTVVNAEITNLKTTSATIDNLKTINAQIETLKTGKADIETLNSAIANINALQTDTASINNLLSGNITAKNIKTGSITAESGIIADGTIGSAQISEIDANLIKSGQINTADVEIIGADGRLKISGDRVQVFQNYQNTMYERVMLGVDDKGNSALILRGSDGKTVLLDQDGLTNIGFSDGFGKVPNGSLDANKIDKETMVTQINGATTSILGTKVTVNGDSVENIVTKQENTLTDHSKKLEQNTLDIQKNTNGLSAKLDSQTYAEDKNVQDGKISDVSKGLDKATTEITAIQGQIELKANQTDVTNEIKNIKIGGTNLASQCDTETSNDRVHIENVPLVSNTQYVMSVYGTVYNGTQVSIKDADGNVLQTIFGWGNLIDPFTFTTINNLPNKVTVEIWGGKDDQTYLNSNKHIKIEQGNKGTGWSPSIRDMNSNASSIAEKLSNQAKADALAQAEKSLTQEEQTRVQQANENLKTALASSDKAKADAIAFTTEKVQVLTNDISSVSADLKVAKDNISAEVSSMKESTTTVAQEVDDIKNKINETVGKWYIEQYNLNGKQITNLSITDIVGLSLESKGFVNDADLTTSMNLDNNALVLAKTNIFLNDAYEMQSYLMTNGDGILFVNGEKVMDLPKNTWATLDCKFAKGWSTVEILFVADGTSGGISFSTGFSKIKEISMINAYSNFETNAITKVSDNLKIGYTNLLLNTGFEDGTTNWAYYGVEKMEVYSEPTSLSGYAIQYKNSTSTQSQDADKMYGIYQRNKINNIETPYKKGEKYVISGYVKSDTIGSKWKVYLEGMSESDTITFQDTDWHYFELKIVADGVGTTFVQYGSQGATFCEKEIKLETGDTATTWSYAPQDLATAISQSEVSAVNTAQDYTNAQIKTVNTDVENVKSSIDVLKNEIDLKVTSSEVQNQINNIHIGGVNLAQGTSCEFVSTSNFSLSNDCVYYYDIDLDSLNVGDFITFSFTLKFENVKFQGNPSMILQTNSDGFPRFTIPSSLYDSGDRACLPICCTFGVTQQMKDSQSCQYMIRLDNFVSGTLSLKDYKVEKGNQATAWCPSPQDVDNKINQVQTSTDTKITTVTSEVQALKDSVTLSVQQVTDETKKLNGTLEETQTQVAQATEKLTPNGIVAQVTEGLKGGAFLNGTKVTLTKDAFFVSGNGMVQIQDGCITAFDDNKVESYFLNHDALGICDKVNGSQLGLISSIYKNSLTYDTPNHGCYTTPSSDRTCQGVGVLAGDNAGFLSLAFDDSWTNDNSYHEYLRCHKDGWVHMGTDINFSYENGIVNTLYINPNEVHPIDIGMITVEQNCININSGSTKHLWLNFSVGDVAHNGQGSDEMVLVGNGYATGDYGTLACHDFHAFGLKQRVVDCGDMGFIGMSAYETSTPYFGTIGTAQTDENGECYVLFERDFMETSNTLTDYRVFTTIFSDDLNSKIQVSKKEPTYVKFIGTPNTKFDYEVKAIQKGYEDIKYQKPGFERSLKTNFSANEYAQSEKSENKVTEDNTVMHDLFVERGNKNKRLMDSVQTKVTQNAMDMVDFLNQVYKK